MNELYVLGSVLVFLRQVIDSWLLGFFFVICSISWDPNENWSCLVDILCEFWQETNRVALTLR
jgi:hypothetical protein